MKNMKCPKCGYENKEGAEYCELCKARPTEIIDASFMEQEKKILIDAREKIFWGHTISEVEALLSQGHIPQDGIDKYIRQFAQEYAAIMRREGVHDIGIGAILLLICIKLLLVSIKMVETGQIASSRAPGYILFGCGYGVFLIMRGFEKLIWSVIITKKKRLKKIVL